MNVTASFNLNMKNRKPLKTSVATLGISLALLAISSCGGANSSTSRSGSLSHLTSSLNGDSFSFSSETISGNNKYSNPTYPLVKGAKTPTYIADPDVVRDDDGTFYMYSTQTTCNDGGSSFAPHLGPTWKSNDLVNWVYCGDVFKNYTPNWGTTGAGVWAPTVIKVGSKWNFYYALSTGGDSNPGIGVAVGETPNGPWEHYGKLFNSNEIGVTNSIDPFVIYDNEKLYMAFGSFGGLITIIQLTDDGLGLYQGLDYQKEHKTSIAGYEVNESNNYEATFIYKKNGKFYLFLSTGTCCSGVQSTYHVVVASGDSFLGPYTDSKGRQLFGPNRGDAVVAPSLSGAMGVGHCSVIEDDLGTPWMIYHGYDTKAATSASRVTYLDKLIFDSETNMPHVEGYKASNEEEKNGPYINSLEGNGI